MLRFVLPPADAVPLSADLSAAGGFVRAIDLLEAAPLSLAPFAASSERRGTPCDVVRAALAPLGLHEVVVGKLLSKLGVTRRRCRGTRSYEYTVASLASVPQRERERGRGRAATDALEAEAEAEEAVGGTTTGSMVGAASSGSSSSSDSDSGGGSGSNSLPDPSPSPSPVPRARAAPLAGPAGSRREKALTR